MSGGFLHGHNVALDELVRCGDAKALWAAAVDNVLALDLAVDEVLLVDEGLAPQQHPVHERRRDATDLGNAPQDSEAMGKILVMGWS